MKETDFISRPIGFLDCELFMPGDKSISHRAVILAAIAKGTTTINGFLDGEDCLATLNAVAQMGVTYEGPFDNRLIIHGVGKYGLTPPDSVIHCGNSGTTLRLLTGLLAGQKFPSQLTGDHSLLKRPMERVCRPLSLMGADIHNNQGRPPIYIKPVSQLQGIDYQMPVPSAQVKSAILLAGMYAKGNTEVTEQQFSRDHTERMLTSFSYPLRKANKTIAINSDGEPKGTDIIIPGDISSAAFFIVLASILPGSDLLIRNVGVNPTRTGLLTILQAMGADISIQNKRLCGEEPVADIRVLSAELEGIDIPAALVPLAIDEFPALFIAAAHAKGQTLLHGAKELRFKESDRISVMVEGLQTLGIDTQAFEDGLYIKGGQLKGGIVDSYQDHRIAMAFLIAGAAAKSEVIVKNCKNIQTSFPGFVKTAEKAGLNIEEYHHEF